jgi:endonuclease/exonuclease/phosphatase family metal-dependent hydrolase
MKKLYFLVIIFTFSACDFFDTEFDDNEKALSYKSKNITNSAIPTTSLKIMNWNIKFAGGRIDFFFDCYDNRALMSKSEVLANLKLLADKIKQVNPDVLFINEVDINSKRSAYIDQMQWLLDNTDLNYGVYASQWKADYIPSDGVGRVNSGNAILSKFKLEDAKRIALALIDEQDAITQYFYLRRNILKTKLTLGTKDYYLLGTHTSAYSEDGTKKKQIDQFKSELDNLNSSGETFIAGGDLNALPPGSTLTSGFADSKCEEEYDADDYSEEVDWLVPLYDDYNSAIPLSVYQANQADHFTHTTDKNGFWARKLDYLFTNGSFVLNSGKTHQDASSGGLEMMSRSDHAAIIVELSVQ